MLKKRIFHKSKVKKLRQKNLLIFGDSVIKHIDDWRLNERIRSIVFVWLILVATIKDMIHHVKGC